MESKNITRNQTMKQKLTNLNEEQKFHTQQMTFHSLSLLLLINITSQPNEMQKYQLKSLILLNQLEYHPNTSLIAVSIVANVYTKVYSFLSVFISNQTKQKQNKKKTNTYNCLAMKFNNSSKLFKC